MDYFPVLPGFRFRSIHILNITMLPIFVHLRNKISKWHWQCPDATSEASKAKVIFVSPNVPSMLHSNLSIAFQTHHLSSLSSPLATLSSSMSILCSIRMPSVLPYGTPSPSHLPNRIPMRQSCPGSQQGGRRNSLLFHTTRLTPTCGHAPVLTGWLETDRLRRRDFRLLLQCGQTDDQ